MNSLEAIYIPLALSPKEDIYEIELKRKVHQFGNMEQVGVLSKKELNEIVNQIYEVWAASSYIMKKADGG